MNSSAHSGAYRDRNSTADRALNILEMFNETHLTISAVDVAQELSVARSTAYRYLQSLVSRGFLEESPSGGFRLGLRVLELSRLARRGYGLSDVAVPVMKRLCEQFGQTVLLTRRAGNVVTCIEREVFPGQLVRLSYERGSQLPITAGASALILLAWLPDEEVLDLLESAQRPQFTDKTLTNVDDLVGRLQAIRAAGHALSQGEVDTQATGIAAPVKDRYGGVIAGLSIVSVGPMDTARVEDMVRAVTAAGQEISDILVKAAG